MACGNLQMPTQSWVVMAGAMTERIRVLNGLPAEASLSAGGVLRWRGEVGGSGERTLEVEPEVLGFGTEGKSVRIRAFVNELKGCSCGGADVFGKRVRKDFVLEMPSVEAAEQFSERLRDYINSLDRPKRLFVLVNPFGGKKCAKKIFHTEIKPLLVAANIMFNLQETKYQLHAQEIAYKLDLLKYDGIVCISGDGVLAEVVNGLLKRNDWDTAIRMPLGIIPAGTGNGLAKSLLNAVGEMHSIQHAAFAIIRGHKRFLDVSTIFQGEAKFFSILMLTWGLIADIDIESEKYRWMGGARFEFYCFLRIMNLHKYHGRVEFVPAPEYKFYGEQIKDDRSCLSSIDTSKLHWHTLAAAQQGYQGPSVCFDDSNWRFLEGPFISVSLHNVPWAGQDVKLAPEAESSDGFLDLVIIKDCPKYALSSIMLMMNDGSHVKSPYVKYLKVKAFRLVPGNRVDNPLKGGIIDVDGEVIARGDGIYRYGQGTDPMAYGSPINLAVSKGLATIFAPR